MRIVEYFSLDAEEQARYARAIGRGDWRAAKFLFQLLSENQLRKHCGEGTRLFLGLEGEELAAFCTLADQDEVDAPNLTPWIGFVYTFPAFRGNRRSGEMIEHACALARAEGCERVYISTNEIGLYEKYGFTFMGMLRTVSGEDTRYYSRDLSPEG